MTSPEEAFHEAFQQARQEDHRKTRPVVYSLVVIFVVIMSLLAFTFWYANHAARQAAEESSHKWCALVSTLDNSYRSNPPQSETGKLVASQIHNLRVDFGCP